MHLNMKTEGRKTNSKVRHQNVRRTRHKASIKKSASFPSKLSDPRELLERCINLLQIVVSAFVISHIALRMEAFAAVRAHKWIIIVVNSRVDLQILFLCEALPAPRMITAKWKCAIVHVHVGAQANPPGECLGAAGVRARQDG